MDKKFEIILLNDHENSFEKVMALLLKVCQHSHAQAEQCALIAHGVGSCSIKIGSFDDMFEIHSYLKTKGLNVIFQEYEPVHVH